MEYDKELARFMYRCDRKNHLDYAKKEGWKEGFAKGFVESFLKRFKESFEKGYAKKIRKARAEVISLVERGVPLPEIKKKFGL